eukprot:GGOE01020230.1.p1 GENE.GGOE01020230.1~~GGOE01020230.1.p1  ORF type:complete len:672 (+),score=141.55 GGOE01020230.1:94-2016(+)
MQAPKLSTSGGNGLSRDMGEKGNGATNAGGHRDPIGLPQRDAPVAPKRVLRAAGDPPVTGTAQQVDDPNRTALRLARLWHRCQQQSGLVQLLEETLCAMHDPCVPGSQAQLEDDVRAHNLWSALDRLQVDARAGKLQQVNQSKFTLPAEFIQASPFQNVLQLLHDRLLPTCHRLYHDVTKTLSGVWKMVLLTDSLRTSADRQQCLDVINQCLMRSSIANQNAISHATAIVGLLSKCAKQGTIQLVEMRDASTQTSASRSIRPHLCLSCQHHALEQGGGTPALNVCGVCQGSLLQGCGVCEGKRDARAGPGKFLRLKQSRKEEDTVDGGSLLYSESWRAAEIRCSGRLVSCLRGKEKQEQQKKQVCFTLGLEDTPPSVVFHSPTTAQRLSSEGAHPWTLPIDLATQSDAAEEDSMGMEDGSENGEMAEDETAEAAEVDAYNAPPNPTANVAAGGSESSVADGSTPPREPNTQQSETPMPTARRKVSKLSAAQIARRNARLAAKLDASCRPQRSKVVIPVQLMPPAAPTTEAIDPALVPDEGARQSRQLPSSSLPTEDTPVAPSFAFPLLSQAAALDPRLRGDATVRQLLRLSAGRRASADPVEVAPAVGSTSTPGPPALATTLPEAFGVLLHPLQEGKPPS